MERKLFPALLIACPLLYFSQVGINTKTPHPSSILDIESDTKGLVVPRLTTAAVNNLAATASEGLIVFDKEKKTFVGWDGSKWQNLGYEESNTAPIASNVNVSGIYTVGEILTANYSYADADANPDDASTFIWRKADALSGTNAEDIASASNQVFTLGGTEQGKYIQFCVTPGSSVGASPGIQKCSSWAGPVNAVVNQAPTASAVSITGTAVQGQTLTGNYTYNDNEGNTEGSSVFRWTRSDDTSGTNETTITGATGSTYILTAADINKYIKFYVTPTATSGTLLGTETGSGFVGAIASLPQTSVQFAAVSSSVSEGVGTTTLVLSITNPSATTATSVEVFISGGTGSATDINNYTTQTVTFPAGSSANQTVTLTVTDDALVEGNETIQFGLQNVTGGNNNGAIASGITTNTLTITDNDTVAPIILAAWDTNGLSSCGVSPLAPTTTASNVSVEGLTRGSGVTSSSCAASTWGGSSWATTTVLNTAISTNDFFTFTINANTGNTLSLSSIDMYAYRTSAGPTLSQIQYSIDGGASYNNIGSPITITTSISLYTIDLSSISALQNITSSTTVSFRVVNYNASSTGNFYIGATAGNDYIVRGFVN
ncbi:Calx-beta domain-containing protein [Chryseobacterium salviniae]|uniref:Calx-beta domain-containing protein n=1 Tax=Chryseobacterium salviniae TaxID=3101750 RepID=A0ABU6I0B3_9FLAO|nr:Calx-beta domain-containing protein [Chryseobacterium sp. T9W2-O]MEC3877672.1 Calx-beta domain-containing protein [Chryseobacterium sp. T9W2-O]